MGLTEGLEQPAQAWSSFDEASSAFSDENGLLLDAPEHSEDEDRFVLPGLSVRIRILVVCHGCRENEEVIRIISARKADRSEQAQYLSRLRR